MRGEIYIAFLRSAACALVVSVTGCFPVHKCNYREIGVSHSPDGHYTVSVSDLSCKPEVRKVLATSVSLWDEMAAPPGKLGHVFKINGDYRVSTEWLDDTHLLVKCPACDPRMVETWEYEFEDVTISYSF